MPFESQAQRRFMHARHPEIADRFEAHTPKGAKLPERAGKSRKRSSGRDHCASDRPMKRGGGGRSRSR